MFVPHLKSFDPKVYYVIFLMIYNFISLFICIYYVVPNNLFFIIIFFLINIIYSIRCYIKLVNM